MEFTVVYLVPVVSALVQVVKRFVPDQFIPLLSVILGVVGGYFFLNGDLQGNILNGLIVGLSASGLYDVVKNPVREVVRRVK